MRGSSFLEQLSQAVPGAVIGQNLEALDPWIEIAPERIADACRWLAKSSPVRFDSLQCITAIAWFEPDP